MSSDELSDNLVKLVAYTIVSVKRGEERVLPKGTDQIIITSNLSGEAFTTLIIARYFQSQGYNDLEENEKVQEEERKYLRVHYVVSRRWPREPLKFEERQIDALNGIRDVLAG
jgi:hypothetical protein